MRIFFSITLVAISFIIIAQQPVNDQLPYATIPEAPEQFTPGTVMSRMIDGLGFRYHWATAGLTQDNYGYTPGNDGRTIAQTMDHIYALSKVILNTAKKQPTDFTIDEEPLTIEEKREMTLRNFKEAGTLYAAATELSEHKIIFKRASGESEFPFWNYINGPVEDAVWHAGQIVVLRRSAGNPINPKVNVFLGKLND